MQKNIVFKETRISFSITRSDFWEMPLNDDCGTARFWFGIKSSQYYYDVDDVKLPLKTFGILFFSYNFLISWGNMKLFKRKIK